MIAFARETGIQNDPHSMFREEDEGYIRRWS